VDPNSTCTVEFGSPTEASTAFTVTPTGPNATHCRFIIAVSDGFLPSTNLNRNTVYAVLTLSMTPPIVIKTAPVMGTACQSNDFAKGGLVAWFGVIAFDPEGGTLNYDWSSSMGLPPQVIAPAQIGLDPAFTSAATWTIPDGAEDSLTDLQVAVTATSSASGLQSGTTFSLVPANRPQ